MPFLHNNLELNRCSHCNIDKPYLAAVSSFTTANHNNTNKRYWRCYRCQSCGGVILASAQNDGGPVREIYPSPLVVNEFIPEKAREFLKQAISTIHAPAGSVMLSASSVDAMLKEKGYTNGSLYKRIEAAVEDHLITSEMALWAHEVRLDANDQRHADASAELPSESDAQRIVEFTTALAEFLFVLPAKVQRGIEQVAQGK